MANNYRKFLKLLENWPVDTTKAERDFGIHIREQVKKAFTAGELFQGDQEKCSRAHASLKRLSDDVYNQLYSRYSVSSASGLTGEQCKSVLSSDVLQYLEERNRSWFSWIFKRKS